MTKEKEIFELSEDDGIVYVSIDYPAAYVNIKSAERTYIFSAKQAVELADKLNALIEERGLRSPVYQDD